MVPISGRYFTEAEKGMKRTNLNVNVTKEELDSMKLIQYKLSSTAQMLKTVPEGVSVEDMDRYVASVVNARGECEWLQQNWWDGVLQKYGLTGSVYVDLGDGSLYLQEA